MKRFAWVFLLLAMPSAASAQAIWTMEAFGSKGNPFQTRGSAIGVIAVSHEIVSPRDAASGLPTGKRMHKPMVITKELDKSTPLLMNALVNNENLSSVVLTKWAPNARTGALEPAFTVRLTNASVAAVSSGAHGDPIHGVDIKLGAKRTSGDPVHGVDIKVGFEAYEAVELTYQKIEWTWVDGGITAMDDWEAPVQ